MLIRIHRASRASENDVTPRGVWLNRRQLMLGIGAATALAACKADAAVEARHGRKLEGVARTDFGKGLEPTAFEDAATYNNFYEFGFEKRAIVKAARDFEPRPWTVKVEGECLKPGTYDLDDLIRGPQVEERIYRLRCVETWAAVIPWVGVPLAAVIKRLEPTSRAKYVAFRTLHDPERMPSQKTSALPWPYVEGLRMDEAMNPLTLLAIGMYGEELPNQNGAPIRLVVPWKYGFKSIKSVVGIRFVEKEPPTTWNALQPDEYGFYANVNPEVDHPRWSQASERMLGDSLFTPKRPTLMFNGYAEEVAHLYGGMDLAKKF